MYKILLTGGAGYIGRHIAHLLKKLKDNGQKIDVVILDDLSTGDIEQEPEWPFVKGSYGDKDLVNDLMDKEEFDSIIHVGANCDIDEGQRDPGKIYANNISEMITLMDCAASHGIKSIVFSSSSTVYKTYGMGVDENSELSPETVYAATKYTGEMILRDFEKTYGIKSCILRYFNVAGAAMDGYCGENGVHNRRLIPAIIKSGITGDPITVFGTDYKTRDGSCVRDYIHVDDVAMANWLGLQYIDKNKKSITVNIGTDGGYTVLETVKAFEDISHMKLNVVLGKRRWYAEPPELVSNNNKAKRVLKWEPQYSLQDIFVSEFNWAKKRERMLKAKEENNENQ